MLTGWVDEYEQQTRNDEPWEGPTILALINLIHILGEALLAEPGEGPGFEVARSAYRKAIISD